jgi:site-specific recombinase XerC
MPSTVLLDIAGRRRSPATLPAFHAGRPSHNKGLRYPADPPTVEEIIAVMHATGDDAEGVRLRGLIVVLWRAGLPVSEALALAESDSIQVGARSWSVMAKAASGAKWVWTAGIATEDRVARQRGGMASPSSGAAAPSSP